MDLEEWVMLTLRQQKYGELAQMVKGIQMMRTIFMIRKQAWKGMPKQSMHSLSCDNDSTAITVSLIKYELQTKMYSLTTKRYTNVKKKVQRKLKGTAYIIKDIVPLTNWAHHKQKNDPCNKLCSCAISLYMYKLIVRVL